MLRRLVPRTGCGVAPSPASTSWSPAPSLGGGTTGLLSAGPVQLRFWTSPQADKPPHPSPPSTEGRSSRLVAQPAHLVQSLEEVSHNPTSPVVTGVPPQVAYPDPTFQSADPHGNLMRQGSNDLLYGLPLNDHRLEQVAGSTTRRAASNYPQERQSELELFEFIQAHPLKKIYNPFIRRFEDFKSVFVKKMSKAGFRIHKNGMMFDLPSDRCVINYNLVCPAQTVKQVTKALEVETEEAKRAARDAKFAAEMPDVIIPSKAKKSAKRGSWFSNGTQKSKNGRTSERGWQKEMRLLLEAEGKGPEGAKTLPMEVKNKVISEFMSKAYLVMENPPETLTFIPDVESQKIVVDGDQKVILDLCLKGYNVYIGGGAGTGKTVLLRKLHYELHRKGIKVAMCATTGVAGVHINGYTYHHTFGVPINKGKWNLAAFRAYDVVVIDEVSMLTGSMLRDFDSQAQLARLDSRPFGGMQVVLCGDFLQLSAGSSRDGQDTPLYLEDLFHEALIHIQLTTVRRQNKGDPLYGMLRNLRVGRFDPVIQSLGRSTFETGKQEAITIYPKKAPAELENSRRMAEIPGEALSFTPQRGALECLGLFTPTCHLRFHVEKEKCLIGEEEEVDDLMGVSVGSFTEPGQSEPTFASGPSPKSVLHQELLRVMQSRGFQVVPNDIVIMPCRQQPGNLLTPEGRPRSHGGGDTDFCVRCRVPIGAFVPPSVWKDTLERSIKALRKGASVIGWYEGVEPLEMVPDAISYDLTGSRSGSGTVSAETVGFKVGCRVMVLRNMSQRVTNGTVGHIIGFDKPNSDMFPTMEGGRKKNVGLNQLTDKEYFSQLPIVRLQNGETYQIPPVAEPIGGTAENYYYGHKIFSLPLQAGYAFTVHKVQGLTLHAPVVLDCTDWFACDHLIYVACSRVRSMSQLTVLGVQPNMVTVERAALKFGSELLDAADCTPEQVSELTKQNSESPLGSKPIGSWLLNNATALQTEMAHVPLAPKLPEPCITLGAMEYNPEAETVSPPSSDEDEDEDDEDEDDSQYPMETPTMGDTSPVATQDQATTATATIAPSSVATAEDVTTSTTADEKQHSEPTREATGEKEDTSDFDEMFLQ